jgi:hydrogenase maturation factor
MFFVFIMEFICLLLKWGLMEIAHRQATLSSPSKYKLVKSLPNNFTILQELHWGPGGEACVLSQIDAELTSEAAETQEVLHLRWKGFSKR